MASAYDCGGPMGSPVCLYDFTALNVIPESFVFSMVQAKEVSSPSIFHSLVQKVEECKTDNLSNPHHSTIT
jgi:hypothetical protein